MKVFIEVYIDKWSVFVIVYTHIQTKAVGFVDSPEIKGFFIVSRYQKLDLRIAERKAKEDKEHISFLRQMAKEEREKREAIEKEVEGRCQCQITFFSVADELPN